jgi:hypothetical protein
MPIREMGAMADVQSNNPAQRMSLVGQKHVLPQCNNDGRFASISGPHVGKYYVRCRRDGLAVMERLSLWPRKGRG